MYIGVDIGGTDIKFGVVNEQGALVENYKFPTPKTLEGIIQNIVTVCKELIKNYPVTAIGVGSPGWVCDGTVINAGNLPFKNTPLASLIQEGIGVPVFLGNDAQCAGLAEAVVGRGKGTKNLLMITVGTGIGGAVVIDGKIYSGAFGQAGEVGHMTFDYKGEECPCGRKGCFERYASVSALIRKTKQAAEENPDSVLAQVCWKEGTVTGKTVFAAMDQGCPVADAVYEEYIKMLAIGIESLYWILQPKLVLIGGAISREGMRLLKPLRKELGKKIQIETAELGSDAGVIGAAMLCRVEK